VSAAVRRARWALAAVVALVPLLAAGAAPRAWAISHGVKTFGFTGGMETWTVPEGVEWLSLDVQGGHGGQDTHTAAGGRAGGTSGAVRVQPGEVLRIWVGQVGGGDGAFGWASGGEHGVSPGDGAHESGHSGGGGGGASAVGTAGALLMVAGSGGGGGGDQDGGFYGGPGGDGGSPPQVGSPAALSDRYNDAGAGGCGGCAWADGGPKGSGDHGDNVGIVDGGGAGGGGGGGLRGGVGGKIGSYGSHPLTGIGGGGGGGGSSWIGGGAIDPKLYVSARSCPPDQNTGGPQCNGSVTLEWGAPPARVTATSGDGQHAAIGSEFPSPLRAKVIDALDVPVPAVTVTFTAPDSGPSGRFRDPSTSLVREYRATTDINGVATVAGTIADGLPGAWTAEASVEGAAATPARFALVNDAVGTTTMVSSSADPSVYGQAVSFTAAVLPNAQVADPAVRPSGHVQFFSDDSPLGDAVEVDPSRGTVTLPAVDDLGAGTHQIRAEYEGDAGHLASSATTTQRVEQAATALALTATPNPSDVGEQVVLSAAVAVQEPGRGVPSGDVEFADEDGPLGQVSLDAAAEAELAIPGGPPLGRHEVTATYVGDTDFAAASGAVVQAVGPTATAMQVSSSVNPSARGEPLTLTAAVRRADPGLPVRGQIAFAIDGDEVCVAQPVSMGSNTVTCRIDEPLSPGAHGVRADFASSDPAQADDSHGLLALNVTPARTSTTVAVDPEPSVVGGDVLLTAAVETLAPGSGDPSGTVQFYLDGVAVGLPVPLLDGAAALAPACSLGLDPCSLQIGPHAVEAEYVDDRSVPQFARSHGATPHLVDPAVTATEVSSSVNPAQHGAAVTFTARVAAAPTAGRPRGSLQFLADGEELGDPVAVDRGRAVSGAVDRLAVGDHQVEARYLGATTFSGSSASMTQRVVADTPPGDGGTDPPSEGRGPPAASVKLLTGRTRVDHQGTFVLSVRCAGPADARCDGSLRVRTVRRRSGRRAAVLGLARRDVALGAGQTTALEVDLGRAGERLLSRRVAVRVAAWLAGRPGMPSAGRTLVLLSSRAPTLRALTRTATLDPFGRIAVRVSCAAARGRRCHGRLTLAGPRGRRLGAASLSLPGRRVRRVRVPLTAAAAEQVRSGRRIRARTWAVATVPVGQRITTTSTMKVVNG
jgi:hypothetical protein